MTRRTRLHVPVRAYRTAELLDAGVPPSRLRAQDMRRLSYGVVLHPELSFDAFDYRERCALFAAALRCHHFLSRRSAAAVYGIPSPQPPGGRFDVASFSPLRAPQHRAVLGHRVKPGTMSFRSFAGIRLPAPDDVWCQLAAVLTHRELVAAGDFLLSGLPIPNAGGARTEPLCSADDLRDACRRHRGTRGAPARAKALPLLRCPVDSPPESALRLTICQAGFPEPEVQCSVLTSDGEYHADLGYSEPKIAIEYQGIYHFANPGQARFDAERHQRMRDAGWMVIEVFDSDLKCPDVFLSALARALSERGAPAG